MGGTAIFRGVRRAAWVRCAGFGMLAGALVLAVGAGPAVSQGGPTFPSGPPEHTYYVGTTDDSSGAEDCASSGNDDCSLRDAIAQTNADQEHDRIVVPGGTYNLLGAPLRTQDAAGVE